MYWIHEHPGHSAAGHLALADRLGGATPGAGPAHGRGASPVRLPAGRGARRRRRADERHPGVGQPVLRAAGRGQAAVQHADPVGADLKDSLTMGRTFVSGAPAVDAEWFRPNVWPAECPELEASCEQFAGQVRQLYYELLGLCAVALELP